uniref:Uncharacterized protein n=1 Tax=viral metagenome TaxID=1070528 RepID=A0A6M3J5M8_9ZZZZ
MKRLRTNESMPAATEADCQLKTLSRKEITTRVKKRDKQIEDNTPNVTLLSGESVSRKLYDIIQLHGKPHSIPILNLAKPSYEDINGRGGCYDQRY